MGKKKVLIVDDELDVRIYVATLFETSGYEPVAARNGKEGLAKARQMAPDLIILDVMMPAAGGVNMLRELKSDEALKHIPVIMLTGVGQASFDHCLKMLDVQRGGPIAHPDAYMQKPLDHEKLLAAAEKILHGRRHGP